MTAWHTTPCTTSPERDERKPGSSAARRTRGGRRPLSATRASRKRPGGGNVRTRRKESRINRSRLKSMRPVRPQPAQRPCGSVISRASPPSSTSRVVGLFARRVARRTRTGGRVGPRSWRDSDRGITNMPGGLIEQSSESARQEDETMNTMLALMLLVQAGAVPVYSGDRRDEPPRRRGPLTSRCCWCVRTSPRRRDVHPARLVHGGEERGDRSGDREGCRTRRRPEARATRLPASPRQDLNHRRHAGDRAPIRGGGRRGGYRTAGLSATRELREPEAGPGLCGLLSEALRQG
jgi:hypothetical protein